HQLEIHVGDDSEQSRHLVEHLAVLARRADDRLRLRRAVTQAADDRGHFYGLRTGSEDDEDSAGHESRGKGPGRERAVNIGWCSPERQRTADRRTPQARRKKGGEGAGHLAGGGRIPYISGPLHDMSLPLLAFFTALAVSLAGAALLVRRSEAGR